MKLNKSILALAVLGSFSAGSAIAASSSIAVVNNLVDPTSGGVDFDNTATANIGKKIDAEYRLFPLDSASVKYDVDANPGSGVTDRAVVYTPAVALSDGTSLEFTMTKGGLASDATMFLAVYDDDLGGAGVGQWVQVAALTDFTEVTSSDGSSYYTKANFIIDTANMISAGKYVPTADTDGSANTGAFNTITSDGDPIPAGTLIQLFTDNSNFNVDNGAGTDVDLPIIVVPAGDVNGDKVEIQVTGSRDNASNPLEAPKTGLATLVELVDGLDFSIDTAATSTIDVENSTLSRGGFVVEAGGDTPNVVTSEAIVSLDNTAEYTWDLTDATDTYTLTIDRSEGDQGVTDIELEALNFTASGTDSSWSLMSDMAAAGLDDTGTAKDFEIFVNTTDNNTVNAVSPSVLATGAWKVTLNLDPDDDASALPDVAAFDVEVDLTSHTWGINGMQAKVPYVYSINSAGWVSVMKFTNESTTGTPADIRMDIVVYNATTGASVIPTGTEFTNVSLGTVDSQGQAAYLGSDIVTAINTQTPNTLDAAENYHFGVTFTVVAPQNSVHLAVQNKSPDSRADAPVLYNINEVCTVTTIDNVGEESAHEGCKASRVWQ